MMKMMIWKPLVIVQKIRRTGVGSTFLLYSFLLFMIPHSVIFGEGGGETGYLG